MSPCLPSFAQAKPAAPEAAAPPPKPARPPPKPARPSSTSGGPKPAPRRSAPTLSIPVADEPDTLELAPVPTTEGLPAIAAELGLSEAHLARYEGLWAVSGVANDVLPAATAVVFLGKSGLDEKTPGTLRKIWGLADSEAPHGQLSKHEFFRACKLIALAQSNKPIALDQLATPTPLPLLEHGGGVVQ